MKRSTRIAVTLMCMVAISATPAVAQQAEIAPEMNRAASAGLDQALRVIAESNNPGLLGLESTREADSARLGAPVAVATLSFDALLAYQPETPLEKYLAGPARSVVPVEVDGEVRAWVSLESDGARWKMTGFGESANARAVDKAVRSARGRQVGLLHAPAFNLWLVSITGDGGTEFVPVGPATIAEMKPGEAVRAEEALTRLAEHARNIEAEYGEEIRARRVVD